MREGKRVGDYYISVGGNWVHVCLWPVCQGHYGGGLYFHKFWWRTMERCVRLAYERALDMTANRRAVKARADLAEQHLSDLIETFGPEVSR